MQARRIMKTASSIAAAFARARLSTQLVDPRHRRRKCHVEAAWEESARHPYCAQPRRHVGLLPGRSGQQLRKWLKIPVVKRKRDPFRDMDCDALRTMR